MRKKLLAFAAATALTGLFSSGPATAQGTVIIAGPAAQTVGYLTPAMVAVAGTTVDYVGADIQSHNVVSVETGPNTQSWCTLFPYDECPLFYSAQASVGAKPVLGLENAVPGTLYHFYCYPHPFTMKGQLLLLPSY
jgi:plastocyanin